jgi:hypothetical protein
MSKVEPDVITWRIHTNDPYAQFETMYSALVIPSAGGCLCQRRYT